MQNYEVMIWNESGVIVLKKILKADSENEAIQQIIDNVEILDGDSIKISKKEEN